MVYKYVTYQIGLFIKKNHLNNKRLKSPIKKKSLASRVDKKDSIKKLSKK